MLPAFEQGLGRAARAAQVVEPFHQLVQRGVADGHGGHLGAVVGLEAQHQGRHRGDGAAYPHIIFAFFRGEPEQLLALGEHPPLHLLQGVGAVAQFPGLYAAQRGAVEKAGP